MPNMESPCSMNVIGSQSPPKWPLLFQIYLVWIIIRRLFLFFFCTRFWRGCHGGLMNGRSCVCVALEMDGTCVGE